MHSLLGLNVEGVGEAAPERLPGSLSSHHRVASSDRVLKIRQKMQWEQKPPPRVTAAGGWGNFMSPPKAEQFRAHADECERRASHSRDPQLKAQFMELASDWRQLAKQVERIAHDRESAPKTLRTVEE